MHGKPYRAIILAMQASALSTLIQALQQATTRHHRTVLVLSGSQTWAAKQACFIAEAAGQAVWIGESSAAPAAAFPASKARQVLGSEYALAVMDCWNGFHPDALAALTGTVVAGGLLVLLTPPLAEWWHTPDPDYARLATYPHDWQTLPQRFLQRVAGILAISPGVLLLNEADQPDFTGFCWQWPTMPESASTASPNPEQQALLDALLTHQQTAVVLAQRGRGKSALLGFVAHALHASGKRVLLTAPSRAAAHSVFRHAGGGIEKSDIAFLAPDGILADEAVHADVLLVDEAAAISLPLLLGLLARFPRVIFASTTEGYEGTGQGFVLRFLRELDQHAPGWQHHTLAAPIRWAAGDPLEALAYRLFLLDAEPVNAESVDAEPAAVELQSRSVSQAELAADEVLLQQVYGLLRSAHYRTTPDDLRFLLDAPGVSIEVMTMGAAVIGVALLVREGELDDAMAQAIAAGQRRPRGHLLVQTLAVQEARSLYLQQRVSRVVRIAIHPQLQGQGYGSQLLQHLILDQQQQSVEVLGSSFSATPDVLAFWQRNGFSLVRIGHRRQTASAAPSAVVVRVLD